MLEILKSNVFTRYWNAVRAIYRPYDLYDEYYKENGSSWKVPFMGTGRMFYVFSDPEVVEKIFKGSPDIYHAGEANFLFRRILGDNSVLVVDGEQHKKERKILTPPLHGGRMRLYNKTIEDVTIEEIGEQLKKSSNFDLKEVFKRTTLEVILKTVFGLSDGPLLDDLRQDLMKLQTLNNRGTTLGLFFPFLQTDLGPLSPYGAFLKLQKNIDVNIYKLIEQKRKKEIPGDDDILAMMLEAKYDDGAGIEDKVIRDQLLTMLLAGQDTTTSSLCWFFRWLFCEEDVFAKIKKNLSNYESIEEAAKDEYLDCVIKESLRLYPVFPLVVRIVKEDVNLGKYLVPSGSFVSPHIYGVHHNPDIYSDSKTFRPERFQERSYTPFEYFPFGGGARRCIGGAFAMNQIKISIATIIRNFEITGRNTDRPIPMRLGFSMTPKHGVPVEINRVH